MLRSYLKLGIRNLWKQKTLSAINIIGLAAGLCCVLLAIMYWRDERSYDTFHTNRSNLYRVTTSIIENKGDKAIVTGGTGQVQGPAFKALVPEVAEYVRLLGGGIYNDYAGNEKILKLKLLFGDDNFFNVFSFKLIKGDPNTALKELNSVVLTASTALKLFKTTDVLGKELHMQADPSAQRLGKPLVISGVVEDLPGHSSIQFEVLHPFRFLQLSFEDQNWVNAYLGTFVVLNPNADKQAVIKKLNAVYERYAAEQIKNNGHDPKISYGLQPVTDIHLNPLTENGSSMEGGISNGSRPIFSYLFLAISMFILIMASINFINISIGASLKRIREVGIRKIAGSNRIQIILQFLGESAILSTIAFVLALLTTNAALPVFNRLAGKELSLQNLDAGSLTWFLLLFLTNIVLTGLYPAYVLSNFKPIEALQSRQKLFSRNMFGQALVVVQFSLSVLLIVASIVLFTQMKFVKTKDLGYQPDQVIKTSIPGNRDYKPIREFLKNEVAKEPAIIQIAFGGDAGTYNTQVNDREIKTTYRRIDSSYLKTLEIKLKEGNNFQNGKVDEAIVNEAFVKAAGLKNPVGQTVKADEGNRLFTITGVVKDFHFGSLKDRIQPLMMYQDLEASGDIWVKFEQAQQEKALSAFEKIYKEVVADTYYEYKFLTELNALEYQQEQRWETLISYATVLSLLICCLGLFGLSGLSIQQRVKEIGVRKVLGASIMQITSLLSWQFIKLVILAFIIAAPIGWWATHEWLQNFAYRIEVSWWMFGLAGMGAILIALLTIGHHAIKAAIANPVKSLRTE